MFHTCIYVDGAVKLPSFRTETPRNSGSSLWRSADRKPWCHSVDSNPVRFFSSGGPSYNSQGCPSAWIRGDNPVPQRLLRLWLRRVLFTAVRKRYSSVHCSFTDRKWSNSKHRQNQILLLGYFQFFLPKSVIGCTHRSPTSTQSEQYMPPDFLPCQHPPQLAPAVWGICFAV